jgi:hypothetical protein
LRIARKYPVHNHVEVVAEYRRHGTNMTRNSALMLKSEITVLRRQRKYTKKSRQYREAYEAGMEHSREYFGKPLIEEVKSSARKCEWRRTIEDASVLLRYNPRGLISSP